GALAQARPFFVSKVLLSQLESALLEPLARGRTTLALAVGLAGALQPEEAVAKRLTGVGRRSLTDLTTGRVTPSLLRGLGLFVRSSAVAAGVDDKVLSADALGDRLAVSHVLLGRHIVRHVQREPVRVLDAGFLQTLHSLVDAQPASVAHVEINCRVR